jgi:hypothetical protein
MGHTFYSNQVPRLLRALETIAEGMDLKANLAERLEVTELALSLPSGLVTCNDGYSVVIGPCTEAGNRGLSFASSRDSLLESYSSGEHEGVVVSYTEVPPLVIAQVIINHGGIKNG